MLIVKLEYAPGGDMYRQKEVGQLVIEPRQTIKAASAELTTDYQYRLYGQYNKELKEGYFSVAVHDCVSSSWCVVNECIKAMKL